MDEIRQNSCFSFKSLFITSAIAIDVSVSLVLFTTAARTLYHTFKTVGPTQQSFVSLKSEQA